MKLSMRADADASGRGQAPSPEFLAASREH
jgi:hypothetical protein